MEKILDKHQYEYCATLIWGVIPIDREWAEGTAIFKSKSEILLQEYDFEKEKQWSIKLKQLSKINIIDALAGSIQNNNNLGAWEEWFWKKGF